MLPWQISLEGAPPLKAKNLNPEPSLMKHFCSINIHENPCEELQTGLMCDIGANNKEPATIQRLIAAGMTIARLDLRDLEPESCSQLVQSVRQAVYNYSTELEFVYPLALVVDVKGPDVVTGNLKSGPGSFIDILENSTIKLTNDEQWLNSGTPECLYFKYDDLSQLNKQDIIWIDSVGANKIKLVISIVGTNSVDCVCIIGGKIGARMTVRFSQMPQEVTPSKTGGGDSSSSISCSTASSIDFEQQDQQINWVVASDVDAIFAPNAQNSYDIKSLKVLLGDKGNHILVFACIESVLGFDNIDAILAEADGIYVDRSVLSLDLALEKIFIAQKVLISKCNMAGKPCISKAVINEQIPTLCVTDLANLALDGVDVLALELHYESPLKRLAPNSVRMAEHCLIAAGVICRQAERVVWQPQIYGNMDLMQRPLEEPTKAIAISAVELAMRSKAVVMICLTNSGRTAKIVSQVRPPCPVIAVTRACHVSRQLRFWRGIRAVHYFDVPKEQWPAEVEARVRCALDYCKAKHVLRAGDPYVILTSTRRSVGYCDAVRLLYASSRDTVVVEDTEK